MLDFVLRNTQTSLTAIIFFLPFNLGSKHRRQRILHVKHVFIVVIRFGAHVHRAALRLKSRDILPQGGAESSKRFLFQKFCDLGSNKSTPDIWLWLMKVYYPKPEYFSNTALKYCQKSAGSHSEFDLRHILQTVKKLCVTANNHQVHQYIFLN